MQILKKLYRYILEWNLFPSEDAIYSPDNDNCPPTSATTTGLQSWLLYQQRVITRVYVISFSISLFFLVLCTLLSRQTKVVTINNPSLKTYQKLQEEYSTFLNCFCSMNTISYQNFISVDVAIHQICSSDFVSQKWIDALYIPDVSRYGAIDFRTTANSQFELLNTLCSLARESISHALSDLNNTLLPTTNVLMEKELFIQTQTSSKRIRTITLLHFGNARKLIQLSTQSNHIISALNTNFIRSVTYHMMFPGFAYYSTYTVWQLTPIDVTSPCSCQYDTCSLPAGFYSLADINDFDVHSILKYHKYNASYMVPGFVGSCTPFEAILQAKLTSLYEIQYVTKLVDYFPSLAQLIPTIQVLNISMPSKYSRDATVNSLADELFLENWTTSIDYDRYYTVCAPKICIYSYTKRTDFGYTITILISLYGGLQTILELLIPRLVKYMMKKGPNTIHSTISTTRIQLNIRSKYQQIIQRLGSYFSILRNKLLNWNLFTSLDRSSEAVQYQRLATRIFVCLLTGSLFILLLYTIISEQTTSVTYYRPSYNSYRQLYMKYQNKLICSCSEMTLAYESFVTLTPTYHPVCSSAFIKQIWFDQLEPNSILTIFAVFMFDWRVMSLDYFKLLAGLCQLAYNTSQHDLEAFRTRTIVTTRLLNEATLQEEINTTVNELIHSMETKFQSVNNILRLLFQVDQYFSGSSYNGQIAVINQPDAKSPKVDILFDRHKLTSFDPKCVCAFDPDCEEQMLIMHNSKPVVVPGFVWRCSIMDSTLHSTLECLYSNTNCLKDILLRYINYTTTAVHVPPLEISQLIRTSPKSTIAVLAENLFVEEWKTSFSYFNYFRACAPDVCQYTYIKRADHLYVITMFLALYGGLTLILRLFVQLLVKIIKRCRQSSNQTTNQNTGSEQMSAIVRFRVCYRWICTSAKTKIVDYNIFQTYSFNQGIDRSTRIRLSRMITRLYICLYIIGIIVLVLYTTIEQRTITTTINHPSSIIAQQLHTKYIGTIECPCTRASIPLEMFVNIRTRFHQICTSIFVAKEWRDGLLNDVRNMSYFSSINDYRPFLSAHLQFLSGLCHHAMNHVNDTIRSFISGSLITTRLLSQTSFNKQLSDLLYQIEANIPITFTHALQFVRTLNHGNALMSVYSSNYRYVGRNYGKDFSSVLYTLPRTYDGLTNCSCGSQSECFQPAAFTWPHYALVKGFLIGCLPSASFLASTLECFFDSDCIKLIHIHIHADLNQTYTHSLNINSTFDSRYQINTTVNDLVSKVFMEEWSVKISYDQYFAACASNLCSYSYIDNANPLYVATTLLGLYSGLIIVLSWWCPQIILLCRYIQIYYQKRRRICTTPSLSTI